MMEKRSVLISILIASILIVSLVLIVTLQGFTKPYNEKNSVETGQVLLDSQKSNYGSLLDSSSLDNDFDNFESFSGGGGGSSSNSDNLDSLTDIQAAGDKKSNLSDDGFINVIVMLKDDEFLEDNEKLKINKSALPEIKLKIKKKEDEVLSTLDSSEFRLKSKYKTVSGFSGEITQKGWDKLEKDPNVEAIYKDKIIHASVFSSFPIINVYDVWDLGFTGKGSVVCVIDSGIDYNHPLLGNGCSGPGCKVVDGINFVVMPGSPPIEGPAMDDYGHGTHVAGIIAGSLGSLKFGVAPDAKLLSVKVLNSIGFGFGSDLQDGIDWCNDKNDEYNIVVTTMSVGTPDVYNSTTCEPDGTGFVARAHALGITLIASSGDHGDYKGITWPACLPNITSVGSTNDLDSISSFTNTDYLLDLLAPGEYITSAELEGDLITMSGTSMAAAHVAGAVALLKEPFPSISPDEMLDALRSTGKIILDPFIPLFFPRIDILKAGQSLVECSHKSHCGWDIIGVQYCKGDDLWQNYTEQICNNPGEFIASCSSLTTSSLLQDCGDDTYSNNYCEDNDLYRNFIDRGCSSYPPPDNCFQTITKEKIQECGEDGYSDNYCYDNDVYRNFIGRGCSGTYCYVVTYREDEPVEDCGEDGYGGNFCYDNDVYRNFLDRGCSSDSCFENIYGEEEFVEECSNGCTEGRCLVEVCETICNYGKCYEYHCRWE